MSTKEWWKKLNRNDIALGTIPFSNELTLILNEKVNRQNCRYLGTYHLVGPIIYGNLITEEYVSMIWEEVVCALANLYSKAIDPSLPNLNVWCLHDGVTPHYALMVLTQPKSSQINGLDEGVLVAS